jgi:hypothetical protein
MLVAALMMLSALGIQKQVFSSRAGEVVFDVASTFVWVGVVGFFVYLIATGRSSTPQFPSQPSVERATWTNARADPGYTFLGLDKLLARIPESRQVLGRRPGWQGRLGATNTVWTVVDPRPEPEDSVSYELAGYVGTVKPSEGMRQFLLTEHFVVERKRRREAPCDSVNQGCKRVEVDTLTATTEPRVIRSKAAGFALRELRIGPPVERDGRFTLPLGKGVIAAAFLRSGRNVPTRVEAQEFPTSSVFLVKDVPSDSVRIYPYVHTQKTLWSPIDLREGTVFSFIPPPFHTVRRAIRPLLGASTWSQWAIGLVTLFSLLVAFVLKLPAPLIEGARRFWKRAAPVEAPGFHEFVDLPRRQPKRKWWRFW